MKATATALFYGMLSEGALELVVQGSGCVRTVAATGFFE